MSDIAKLYNERDVFAKYGQPIPDDLAKEIAEVEATLLNDAADVIIGYLPEDVEQPFPSKIVVAAEYVDGKLNRVASSCKLSIADFFDNAKDVSSDDPGDEDNPDDNNPKSQRNPSIGFTVQFADGKTLKFNTARRTMIEALRYMGLERASKFTERTFKGYKLIGKEQRPVDNSSRNRWQKNVDGWWIYINMSNPTAVECIEGVSKMLNIPLEIEWDEEIPETEPTELPKGKRAKFSLNGGAPVGKNRIVLNAVRQFLCEIPTATFKEVCESFPKHMQGSYGVVTTVEDIEQRMRRNQTESSRWFLEPDDVLCSADGILFVVCNEWGNNFADFRNHIINEFGWTIEEA